MLAGKAELLLPSGKRIQLDYTISSMGQGLFSGQLTGDIAALDPGLFADRLRLACAEGPVLDIAVEVRGDHSLSFVGSSTA